MGKLETPAWIREGFDSKADWEKAQGKKGAKASTGKTESKTPSKKSGAKVSGKTYKVKKCPKCKSNNVAVVLTGEEGKGTREWECKKCKWVGKNVDIAEVSEDEFLKLGEEK